MAITLSSLSCAVRPGNSRGSAATDGDDFGLGARLDGSSVGEGDAVGSSSTEADGSTGALDAALLTADPLGSPAPPESGPSQATQASPRAATMSTVRSTFMPGTLTRRAPQQTEVADL
ncbi:MULTISPECIES: hypothetical protein [Streptomyces]|uniref:Uncharacterized protein n=1 Tax=Streptomyces halstedii TaxID=1944 RepID=A0A6N9U5H3_STRHA|nr:MULTISPECIES: hypothetical protein [Streptomyces]NEA19070.1 hypothetical protein [Streptomyces halstedii]